MTGYCGNGGNGGIYTVTEDPGHRAENQCQCGVAVYTGKVCGTACSGLNEATVTCRCYEKELTRIAGKPHHD